jgi:hypothetical protein
MCFNLSCMIFNLIMQLCRQFTANPSFFPFATYFLCHGKEILKSFIFCHLFELLHSSSLLINQLLKIQTEVYASTESVGRSDGIHCMICSHLSAIEGGTFAQFYFGSCLENLGTSKSHNPMGFHGLVHR